MKLNYELENCMFVRKVTRFLKDCHTYLRIIGNCTFLKESHTIMMRHSVRHNIYRIHAFQILLLHQFMMRMILYVLIQIHALFYAPQRTVRFLKNHTQL